MSADIDLDFGNRDEILKHLKHVPAMILREDGPVKHNSGVYVSAIPMDPLTAYAAIDYEEAERLGYFKIDFLNVSVYGMIDDEAHLQRLIDREPNWNRLKDRAFVPRVMHIGNHFDTVSRMQPRNIDQMAMLLAVIRPGKKHLVSKPWDEIAETVWDGDAVGGYVFKRAHAFSYAQLVMVHINLLEEQGY